MSQEKIKRNKKIIALRRKGLSYRQLSKLFGINLRQVFRVVKRAKTRAVHKSVDR